MFRLGIPFGAASRAICGTPAHPNPFARQPHAEGVTLRRWKGSSLSGAAAKGTYKLIGSKLIFLTGPYGKIHWYGAWKLRTSNAAHDFPDESQGALAAWRLPGRRQRALALSLGGVAAPSSLRWDHAGGGRPRAAAGQAGHTSLMAVGLGILAHWFLVARTGMARTVLRCG